MDVTLTARTGRTTGTRPSRRLRGEGDVPATVYGLGQDPISVSVEWPELRKALTTEAGMNALIDLEVDGSTTLTIVKDLQRHPIRRSVIHVDFLRIDRDADVEVEVPIVVVGEAEDLDRRGGMLEQSMYTLTVKAKPGSIPTQLDLDVTGGDIGTTWTVSDIVLPEGVTTEVAGEDPVASGTATRATLEAERIAEGGEGDAAGEDDATAGDD